MGTEAVAVEIAVTAALNASAKDSRAREGWEWEDLISEQARGLTGSQLTKGKMGDKGEIYKVLPMPDYRARLIKIAALAMAAIEAFDKQGG